MKKKILTITVLLALIITLAGCGTSESKSENNPLIGKWEFVSDNGVCNYEFKSNNKVVFDWLLNNDWTRWDFNYEVKNGQIVLNDGGSFSDNQYNEQKKQDPIDFILDGKKLIIDGTEFTKVDEFTIENKTDYKNYV